MTDISRPLTDAWLTAVKEGLVRTTTVLSEDRTVFGQALVKGTRIDVSIELDPSSGGPRLRARLGDGSDLLSTQPPPRRVGPFSVIRNQLRQIRPNAPKDPSLGRQPDFVPTGADSCRFACRPHHALPPDSVQRRTPVSIVSLPHGSWAALANSIPLEQRGHVILLPVLEENHVLIYPHRPQMLRRDDVDDLITFQTLNPEYIVFFNSIHAGGTVDHIHGQAVHRSNSPLAAEHAVASFMDSQGNCATLSEYGYAARGLVFKRDSPTDEIFDRVDECQQNAIPVNFVVTDRAVFMFARDRENEVVAEFPSAVLASLELVGLLLTDRQDVYTSVTADDICGALSRTTIAIR